MSADITIDESNLASFRSTHLVPTAILLNLREYKRLSYQLALGVGKSVAADQLLMSPDTYQQYRRVLYIAPTREIVMSRSPFFQQCPVPWVYLESRPRVKCGSLDSEWLKYEKTSRTAQGKLDLCQRCPMNTGEISCFWPKSLKKKIGDCGLVLLTEAMILEVTDLVGLVNSLDPDDPRPVLMIFDEVSFVNQQLSQRLTATDLSRFLSVLREMTDGGLLPPTAEGQRWCQSLEDVLNATPENLQEVRKCFPRDLNWEAVKVQRHGVRKFHDFKYLGYLLADFAKVQWNEQWKDKNGDIVFLRRPDTDGHLLFLHGYHYPQYLRDRLGLLDITAPFSNIRFQHSGTRILNIRDAAGADCHFSGNMERILNFFLQLIARNIAAGEKTMLLCRKARLEACSNYLTRKLKERGLDVIFVHDREKAFSIGCAKPAVIPIINYGAIGSNAFEDYQHCYCLQSYNVSADHVEQIVWDGKPRSSGASRLSIRADQYGVRRVEITNGEYGVLDFAQNVYSELEISPILQAIGRCRPFTKPREVILFQQADFRSILGPSVIEFRTLTEARRTLGLKDFRTGRKEDQIAEALVLVASGVNVTDAADHCGVSRMTIYRSLKRLADQRPA